ncbi:uncharacterized protein NECHADRAFT_85237 [Fusarium vanettenii 77-13-4]|uniref:Heterokaryon incompatibility domain-containing protein n=1 Tax=Fusarium vanettenii (strain ATCC MYA-4622 / CBS 123669 / FGSC 9596 / NRRL 45880 / 77-13-4) TaxID=660122 RepID=C7YVD5_FUSV7|nr:uncharacterized protein NECHADRAFT_85237 [Fusarium vanettenii 77-13-4]EEU44566.1 predicted protein [Fusarium vanettenii 77-13-4]
MSIVPNTCENARRWQSLTVDQNLCKFCQAIDFEKAVNLLEHSSTSGDSSDDDDDYQPTALADSRGLLIASLGDSFKDRPLGRCRMCKIMWENKQQHMARLGELNETLTMAGSDSLWALPFSAKLFGPHSIQTSAIPYKLGREAGFSVFMVVPDPYTPRDFSVPDKRAQKLSLNRDNNMPVATVRDKRRDGSLLYMPKLLPPTFDSRLASDWLQKCKAHHDGSCRPQPNVNTEIVLIDCTDYEIKSLNMSYSYIALSYVWGDVVPTPLINGVQVPPTTSAVILDAIQVTKALGFRYLWADQYCINQTDPVVKMRQINQMDQVYGQAELTIVAACGDSAAYGLPGVSHRRSREQFQQPIEQGNYQVVELGPDALSDTASSKWSTRGWTFQEAWLSRRLLVFTDKQCYFECEAISCAESLDYGECIWDFDDRPRNFRRLEFGPFSRFDELTSLLWPSAHIDEVRTLLHSFSMRQVRFDQDSLNAVVGVLNSSQKMHLGTEYGAAGGSVLFTSAVGIPLLVGEYNGQPVLQQTLVTGMSWVHVVSGRGRSLQGAIPRRRTAYPSWTWAGWEGAIETLWIWMHNIDFDSAMENTHVTTHQKGSKTWIPISEVKPTTQAVTLCFDALQIPHDWLGFNVGLDEWQLLGLSTWLYETEPIVPTDLLGSLQSGHHSLALVGYSSEEWKCLAWILRKTTSAWARAGVLYLERGNPAVAEFNSMDQTRSTVPWEVE